MVNNPNVFLSISKHTSQAGASFKPATHEKTILNGNYEREKYK